MNNDQALEILTAKRSAVNNAINNLHKYVQETDNWKTAVLTAQMAAIKASAATVGADIAAWDGTPAPVPVEVESYV